MRKSKLLTGVLTLVFILSFLALTPTPQASAACVPSGYRSVVAYGGSTSGGQSVCMRDHGYREVITVDAKASGTVSTYFAWSFAYAEHGNIIIKSQSSGYYVNLNRVLQPNGYWLATSFPYESNLLGVDQRVDYNSSTLSLIRLSVKALPNDARNWYLMPDRSGVSSSSSVIWYSVYSNPRSYWI